MRLHLAAYDTGAGASGTKTNKQTGELEILSGRTGQINRQTNTHTRSTVEVPPDLKKEEESLFFRV